MSNRIRIIAGVVVIMVAGIGIWYWLSSGHESTDDAQIEGHVTPIAPRVGGTVLSVPVVDNQTVAAGAVLVQIDPKDYQVALEKAKAELADAEAALTAAQSNIPITSATTTGNVTSAQGTVEQAGSAVAAGQKEVDAAKARFAAAQARLREAQANSTKASKDVERLRGLLAKDEVSQQQFDAASAAADAARAGVDSAASQAAEADAGINVAQSHLIQARAGEQQAKANLDTARTGPEQVTAAKARAAAAQARVDQMKAAVQQAELNLHYATIAAPQAGIVSRKSVEVGQVIQPGQPLMAVIPLEGVWVVANFKETQLTDMRPGQRARITVDAYGGREFAGKVDSIAAATGARFSMLPPENATGNYVKVVQRVPVKIVLDPGQDPEHLLRPGMSVVPTVYFK
jgi:membrane fusion protein (multidrug efflux system)